MSNLIAISKKDEIGEGGYLALDVGEEFVLVGKSGGQYWSVSGVCPHLNFQMRAPQTPYINDGCITCPLHNAKFDLRTGQGLNRRARNGLKQFKIVEDGGTLYIEL